MEAATKEFETSKIEEQKKAYLEAHKKFNHDQIQNMSKTQQKKHEKSIIQNWTNFNSGLGQSLSLDHAVMYMQNALSCIEHRILNELRYSLHFK